MGISSNAPALATCGLVGASVKLSSTFWWHYEEHAALCVHFNNTGYWLNENPPIL